MGASLHGLPETWVQAVDDGWAAVPAADMLSADSQAWRSSGVASVTPAEAVSFAIASRLLKYGQSVTLVIPRPSTETLLRLLSYLHRLRIDAMDGAIRAPWLQPLQMAKRGDLVLWTRPLARYRQFGVARDLHTYILRPPTLLNAGTPGMLRTVLVDGTNVDIMAALDAVERCVTPFAFLIDATPAGVGAAAADLDTNLSQYFPTIPRIVLASLGDTPTIDGLAHNGTTTHMWRVRLGDLERLPKTVSGGLSRHAELTLIEDAVASSNLENASFRFQTLTRAVQREQHTVRQRGLPPLSKVLQTLRALCVPLPMLETALTHAIRAGPFPILPLCRWLHYAAGTDYRYGETDAAAKVAREALTATYSLFKEARTGKTQAVLSMVQESLAKGRKVLVLVGSEIDSSTLSSWLDQECSLDSSNLVSVRAMDGVRNNFRDPPWADHVIIAGTLWPSRRHWLALPSERLSVLCYPFEADALRRQLIQWWDRSGRPSAPAGDKFRLWQLQWPQTGRCLDLQISDIDAGPAVTEVSFPVTGLYPQKAKVVQIPLVDRHENWLDALMAEPEDSASIADRGASVPDMEIVWIHLAEHFEALPWPRRRPTQVLSGEEIVSKLPEDLCPEDELLLLVHGEERIATQTALFDMFVSESVGLEQHALFAAKWQPMVDTVLSQLQSIRAVQEQLKRGGVRITEQSIRNWVSHKVIGPEDPKVIEIFASIMGHKSPAAHARKMSNAVNAIRLEHRAIGRDLRRAIIERARGATDVQIGKMTLDSTTLDSMIEVCHVVEVQLPPLTVRPYGGDLVSAAEGVQRKYPDRLVFTPAAGRSMKDSAYRNVDRFRRCLELMATRLFDMYRDGVERMHELLPDFKALQISFAPGTAARTQGQFNTYDRLYEGKSVDIGKHFRLGVAHDPSRTMRIHFHWDPECQQIVVHHAGEHLPISKS